MRSRNVVVTGLVTLALIGALILGCSKNSSGPSNPITNPEFNYMVTQANETVDSLVALSGLGLDMTVAASSDILTDIAFGPMPVDSSSLIDLWNIFVLTNSGSGVTNHWVDSVQFLLNGAARQNPAGANEMQYIRNWSSVATDTTVSYRNLDARTVLNAANTSDPSALIGGSFSLAILDVDKSGAEVIVRDLAIDGTVASYSVDRANGWSGGCPTDAQVTMSATLSVQQGAAAPVISTWTFEVTFGNDKPIVKVTQDGASFSYRLRTCAQ
jgi:hypothetical protein